MSNLGSVEFISLFKYFFSIFSFWDSHNAYAGPHDGVPHPSRFSSLFFNPFSFCSSDLIMSILYLHTHSFFCLLTSAFESLFITLSILLSTGISFWNFFFGFLSLYWYLHFVHTSFSWLSLYLPLILWAWFRGLFWSLCLVQLSSGPFQW